MGEQSIVIDLEDPFFVENFEKMKADFKNRVFKKEQIEQIGFRMYLCRKCIDNKKCNFCGCNPIDVLSEPYSCNKGKIFPDFKRELDWSSFKKQHNIEIK